jgi:hypothetical protein
MNSLETNLCGEHLRIMNTVHWALEENHYQVLEFTDHHNHKVATARGLAWASPS